LTKPILTLPLHPYKWVLFLFDDRDALLKWWNKRHPDDVFSESWLAAHAGCVSRHVPSLELCVGCFGGPGVLGHELFHATAAVAENINLPFVYSNSEALAYLYEYAFNNCDAALRESWAKRKRKRAH
jgi:hypothetical protein